MEARYIVDEDGKRTGVILPIEEYERMIEALEDLEDARAADEVRVAVARGDDEFISYEQAREDIAKGGPPVGELPSHYTQESQ